VEAYFEETQVASVHEGDPAEIKLMGYSQIVRGEVGSVAQCYTRRRRNRAREGYLRSLQAPSRTK
jgi:hypothetical protein